MNSRQLEYFLAVARELNFTKAAESMYVSQTAVTQQIKALEQQLGVSLFERTKKKVALTPAGNVFWHEANLILQRIDTAVERTREASSGFLGSLEIGFSVGMGNTALSSKIQAFNEKYPNIVMRFFNQSPSMLLKQVKEGALDIVLMPMFEERYYEEVQIQKIDSFRLNAIVPQSHMLAQKAYVTRRDLKDEDLILASTPEGEIGEDKHILETFWRRGYHPNVVAKIEDVETILFMLSANIGVTILPAYLSIPMMARGRLASVPFGGPEDTIDIIAAWRKDADNPSLEKILPFLQTEQQMESEEDGEE